MIHESLLVDIDDQIANLHLNSPISHDQRVCPRWYLVEDKEPLVIAYMPAASPSRAQRYYGIGDAASRMYDLPGNTPVVAIRS